MGGRKASRFFMRAATNLSRSSAGKKLLDIASRSVTIQRVTLGGPNPIRVWETDSTFKALLADVRPFSLNRPQSLFNLYQFAKATAHLDGDVAEVGVYKGGTGRLLAQVFAGSDKKIFLFDTFAGMPDTINPDVDEWEPGDFGDTSVEAVRKVVGQWPAVSCIAGIFPETAAPVLNRQFALVHIDVDIEQSVRDCLEFFYPRMLAGGALIIDDYGFLSCVGARRAVDEYFMSRPEQPLYLPTGQCVVFRAAHPQMAGHGDGR